MIKLNIFKSSQRYNRNHLTLNEGYRSMLNASNKSRDCYNFESSFQPRISRKESVFERVCNFFKALYNANKSKN